jgi:uncharacterized protein YegL
MRRLPIYFLIDVSESMVGDPIQQVEEGLATIIKTIKNRPNSHRNSLGFNYNFCRSSKNACAIAGIDKFLSTEISNW